MKKAYTAPRLEVEIYQLDASIASNCGTVINHAEDCTDAWNRVPDAGIMAPPYNVNFDEKCDCYTSGGIVGYWLS